MTNQEVLKKLIEDMEMRNFSKYTIYSYYHKGKEIMKYFKKPIEEVITDEIRNFLLKYLKYNKKLSDRSIKTVKI